MSDWWEGKPWRLIQTNLREIDMIDICAAQVVKDMQAFQANVLMINAAGIIASYPTALPYHFQSPYLQGDSLEAIIEACHQADIRVIARTDFSKVRRPIYEQHPEWAYISAAGQVIDYNGDVHVCVTSDFQQIHTLNILEEMFSLLDFDGVFFNMSGFVTRDYSGNYYGPCHCENCRRGFREQFGLDLPQKEEPRDPVFRKYVEFKRCTLRAHHEKVYNFIQQNWPHLCISNHLEFRRGFVRQESNSALDRPLPHWQYIASDNTKWVTSSYPKMTSSNAALESIDYPIRHVSVSPWQQKLRLAQDLANGGGLDYFLFGRMDNHEDRASYAPVKEIFHYHAANEESYVNNRSKAKIAVLHDRGFGNVDEFRGWFRFLVENHFLFDTLMTDTALELPWDKYDTLVLPDFQPIGDDLAERIDRFVQEGGTLIAVGRSGFCDARFEPRTQPALKSLGIHAVQRIRHDLRPAYFKFEDKTGFPRFADTDLLYLDGTYIYATYVEDAQPRLKLIPPHPFGPPERTYYSVVTDHPGFVIYPFGRGRTVYLPWLPGALFHRQGYDNTILFIADLLEHVAGVQPVQGNLSSMVEVTHFANQAGHFELVHLVNGSGHFGTSFVEPLPIYNTQIALPVDRQPQAVRSLVREEPCDYTWQDGVLTLQIPCLTLFDAIRIDTSA